MATEARAIRAGIKGLGQTEGPAVSQLTKPVAQIILASPLAEHPLVGRAHPES